MKTDTLFHVGAYTDIGRKRRRNEDSVHAAVLTGTPAAASAAILAVADGMGGLFGGEVASRIAIETAVEELTRRWQDETEASIDDAAWRDALQETYRRCLDAMRRRIEGDDDLSEMGTTLTSLILSRGRAHYAHVGDSRGYRFRSGKLQRMTTDHNVAQELAADGRISSEEAATHPKRNVLTKWLAGDVLRIDPEIGAFEAQPGDVYLLCSDGLYTHVSDDELEEALQEALPEGDAPRLDELADSLIGLANARGGKDNISLVVGVCR